MLYLFSCIQREEQNNSLNGTPKSHENIADAFYIKLLICVASFYLLLQPTHHKIILSVVYSEFNSVLKCHF